MSENLLSTINSSADVKALDRSALPKLCAEVREKIIDTVSHNGGHLASNLGAVEFTVALHRVFDSEKDRFVFDVSHQSYTHKLLTGRGMRFDTLRKKGGISGFQKISEGDPFGAGHSSTSVSAALGMAVAMKKNKSKNYAIAVIGDGALTGGIAYEGLNNAGKSNANVLVLLNENDMSISANVGAFSEYLSKLASGENYFAFKDNVKAFLSNTPLIGKSLFNAANKVKEFSKNFVELPERNFFEDFGFSYFGPIDGHDIAAMETVFERVKFLQRPCVVHVKTVKGKGYAPAEKMPSLYHGVCSFDRETGLSTEKKKSFSSVVADKLCESAENDGRICAITAAMTDGVELSNFARRYPDRFFDVGIAEEHAAIFAAGLAREGVKPVFLCYSSFLQRAYDQIIHDVALQNLPVVFGVDRAGFVGADGDTHNGLFDVAMFNAFDNIEIYSPATYTGTEYALENALKSGKIAVVRYPRGAESQSLPDEFYGEADMAGVGVEGAKNVIITYGRICENVLKARQIIENGGEKTGVVLLTKIKPVDAEKLKLLVGAASKVAVVEETVACGGIGAALAPLFSDRQFVGIASKSAFVPQGTVEEQMSMAGLDPQAIAKTVTEYGR